MKNSVTVLKYQLTIPTYNEPEAEEMPMFAENRVHQRTSGNPYPSKVVLEVDRKNKSDKEYTAISLENEYIKIVLLPELGGRIYSATDKTTGYDFFYKQHVIKPALIGVLGSWISGGVEFNWPFHHRASTFMPVDYTIEENPDGSAIVWFSEHDPLERMKGMVGISLKPGETIFETRVRLFNRTSVARSFLWWENAAVPVNKDYQIFFPTDVSYVNFHYKRSVTTYPVANNALGVYNGIRYNGDTDISMHKNTIQPTSYFSAPSKYDFFGGYDHSKECGVVHIADHHISPGKKMFTWAYNQLSKSWENALTDTDGAYAELMAGSYSDNQPDFSWIEPYETKAFSQYWFPISKIGTPVFANHNGAISFKDGKLLIETTKNFPNAEIIITDGKVTTILKTADLNAAEPIALDCNNKIGTTVTVNCNGTVLQYTVQKPNDLSIPDTTKDMPNIKAVKTAQELYLEGVHVFQYRDPKISPMVYWNEALQRDPEHIATLISVAEYYYKKFNFECALKYAKKALAVATKYNKQPQSGKISYILGLIYFALGNTDLAYSSFYKSSWNSDYYSASMTHIAAIDGFRNNYNEMVEHSQNALNYNSRNYVAKAYGAIGLFRLGKTDSAISEIEAVLQNDPLCHIARAAYCLCGKISLSEFYAELKSDPEQTVLDVAIELTNCGEKEFADLLIKNLKNKGPVSYYFLNDIANAEQARINKIYPFRAEEYILLQNVVNNNPDLPMANYYFGCICYHSGQYEMAAEKFEKCISICPDFADAYRALAVAYYSHLKKPELSLDMINKALKIRPNDKQLIFEKITLMSKLGIDPKEQVDFIVSTNISVMRDDICIELARAYNQSGNYESALKLLNEHSFVPCEGGEHAVAEQFIFAWYSIGRHLILKGNYKDALNAFRSAQVLPQNLGAGLWNECRLVPSKYYEAICLENLGEELKAKEIYQYIICLKLDYFSNMHLPELPYYLAMSYKKLGEEKVARAIIDESYKKWSAALDTKCEGYFSTTPFFISYCDCAENMRDSYYKYLLAFIEKYQSNQSNAQALFSQSFKLDPTKLYSLLESQL